MKVVLGIDAAWTEMQPSGLALIVDDGGGWRLVEAAASYAAFLEASDPAVPVLRHRGSVPDAGAIIKAASAKSGAPVDLVAIDMPLSTAPIVGRRASDNMISVAYGARHASTHTPSVARAGRLSDELRIGFDAVGYPLALSAFGGQALIEVYPHPALIELMSAERRLPYKQSKVRKYWPALVPGMRRRRLLEVWAEIIQHLEGEVQGVTAALSLPSFDARGYQMKAFEDALDAVVCAWVGACALDGKAKAYGGGESAIWVPVRG
ncbi:Hypothetical protein NGAL_HAMBI1146_31870 [Neorhizobium galegae bv. officinalis]|nr:Hypothetical protein NGAL_HAMBI1146_31870 [Neorhizobium galegae bv. officinalis]